MEQFKQLKRALLWAVVVLVCLRLVLWAIEPFIPFLVGGAILVTLVGMLLYRRKL